MGRINGLNGIRQKITHMDHQKQQDYESVQHETALELIQVIGSLIKRLIVLHGAYCALAQIVNSCITKYLHKQ